MTNFHDTDDDLDRYTLKEEDIKGEDEVVFEGSTSFVYTSRNIFLFIVDVLINAVIIIALVTLIRHFIFSPFQVSGPSMCDTLNNFNEKCVHGNGEYIIVNKLFYYEFGDWSISDYDRGDIVVFKPPEGEDNEFFIKRIIGLPGETVTIEGGYVYIYNDEYEDGLKLDEQYLNESNYGKTYPYQDSLVEFEVGDDQYFVMGDNRRASSDSRRCFGLSDCDEELALLDRNLIEGKGWLVLWPLDRLRLLWGYDYQ